MQPPIITPDFIREFDPCYDPVSGRTIAGALICNTGLAEDSKLSLKEFLLINAIPAKDRVWLAMRPGVLPDEQGLRLLAVKWARRALSTAPIQDPLSVAACDVAERYAIGLATKEELLCARVASSIPCKRLSMQCSTSGAAARAAEATTLRDAREAARDTSHSAACAASLRGPGAERRQQVQDIIDLLTFNVLVHP